MDETYFRKKLLSWHYNKSRTINIVDLLQSNYQCFRRRVQMRVDNGELDFREAIRRANLEEMLYLQNVIDEERIDRQLRSKRSRVKKN
jgi:hypothetical protein